MTATMTLEDHDLDHTFAALANATRRAILARLAEGEATVNDLAAPFALSLPTISKHIKVLESAGLVVRSQRAQFRPCSLDPAPLAAAAGWTERYRAIWESRFDQLDAHLRQITTTTATTDETKS